MGKRLRRTRLDGDFVPTSLVRVLMNAGLDAPERYGDLPRWVRLVWHFKPAGLRLEQVVRRVVKEDVGAAVEAVFDLGGIDGFDGFVRGLLASRSAQGRPA